MAVLGRCIHADDERDLIGKAKKRELIEFAHLNGQMDINDTMQCDDYKELDGRVVPGIRTLLRQRGFTRIPIPNRSLWARGRQETRPISKPPAINGAAAGSDEWAEFQEWKRWKASHQQAESADRNPPQQPEITRARPPKYPNRLKPRPPQEINQLRDECKRLGIKMERRDGKAQLKAKIEAHRGQNAPEQRQ